MIHLKNCHDCRFLEVKKNNFTCLYKKCNMGPNVFYPKNREKKRTRWNLGFLVCKFRWRFNFTWKKVKWSKVAECIICGQDFYEIYDKNTCSWVYQVRFFWNDGLYTGFPICPSCIPLLEDHPNLDYGERRHQERMKQWELEEKRTREKKKNKGDIRTWLDP